MSKTFPRYYIDFLLTLHSFDHQKSTLEIVEKTLKQMANGGVFDRIGFGFSRYSTDEMCLIPHFEKILHDNALLLIAYTSCYHVTNDPFYRGISENIVEFISREMMSNKGGFFSAIDADSEGVDGKYYVWEDEEAFDVLGEHFHFSHRIRGRICQCSALCSWIQTNRRTNYCICV